VVLAAEGYPVSPSAGDPISGIEDAVMLEGVDVYAAAVGPVDGGQLVTAGGARGGQLVTAGGRVLGVTALGDDLAAARARAYQAVGMIDWRGITFRRDIAERAGSAATSAATTGGGGL
jgi:phosphoribosylamine--glycine ligase